MNVPRKGESKSHGHDNDIERKRKEDSSRAGRDQRNVFFTKIL